MQSNSPLLCWGRRAVPYAIPVTGPGFVCALVHPHDAPVDVALQPVGAHLRVLAGLQGRGYGWRLNDSPDFTDMV